MIGRALGWRGQRGISNAASTPDLEQSVSDLGIAIVKRDLPEPLLAYYRPEQLILAPDLAPVWLANYGVHPPDLNRAARRRYRLVLASVLAAHMLEVPAWMFALPVPNLLTISQEEARTFLLAGWLTFGERPRLDSHLWTPPEILADWADWPVPSCREWIQLMRHCEAQRDIRPRIVRESTADYST